MILKLSHKAMTLYATIHVCSFGTNSTYSEWLKTLFKLLSLQCEELQWQAKLEGIFSKTKPLQCICTRSRSVVCYTCVLLQSGES